MMPASSMDLTLSLWYAENADGIEMELKIDFSQFLTDWSPNIGLSPGELWELMDLNRDDDTFIQGVDYIVYYTQVFPAEETIAREDAMLINTDGTKLRFSESASTEIDGFDLSGFIMRRK
jgi:hypothetical protein